MSLNEKLSRSLLTEVMSQDVNLTKVDFLLNSGADPNTIVDNTSIVLAAACRNHTQLLGRLIEFSGDPNIQDANGATPLMVACLFGNLEMVNLLIISGADINAKDHLNLNALAYLCAPDKTTSTTDFLKVTQSQVAIFDCLLKNGLDISARVNAAFKPTDILTPELRKHLYNNPNVVVKSLAMLETSNEPSFTPQTATP